MRLYYIVKRDLYEIYNEELLSLPLILQEGKFPTNYGERGCYECVKIYVCIQPKLYEHHPENVRLHVYLGIYKAQI
jgi:hypothetical protein